MTQITPVSSPNAGVRLEPVLGTLINHHNMKRINSRGIAQANKHVLMAALTDNLKKYLKFITRKVHRNAQIMNLQKGKFWFWQNLFSTTSIASIKATRKSEKLSPLKTKTSFKSGF